MKTIVEILRKDNNKIFAKLINKNQNLETLAGIFNSVIDPDIAKNCRLASIEDRVMHISVKNAAWANRVRYYLPEMLKNLHTQPEFHMVASIRYFIERQFAAPIAKKQISNKVSSHNEAMWRKTIAKLRDD